MEVIRFKEYSDFQVVGKICDRCGLRVSAADNFWEFQEFISVKIDVGYGAKVFRDGDLLQCDLCESCTSNLLAPYLRTVSTFEERQRALSMKFQADVQHPGEGPGRTIWSLLDLET